MDIFDSIDSYNKDDSSSQVINDSLLQSEEPEKGLEEVSTSSDFFSSIENYNPEKDRSNEIVNVSAMDKATSKTQSITVTGSGSLSDGDIERMVEEAKSNEEADKEKLDLIESKNS